MFVPKNMKQHVIERFDDKRFIRAATPESSVIFRGPSVWPSDPDLPGHGANLDC